jgi:hypothetical protein
MSGGEDRTDCLGQAVAALFGGGLGLLTASVIDAAVLGWKPADTAPAAPSMLTWSPTTGVAYDASHRATPTLGVTGSF